MELHLHSIENSFKLLELAAKFIFDGGKRQYVCDFKRFCNLLFFYLEAHKTKLSGEKTYKTLFTHTLKRKTEKPKNFKIF